MMRLLVLLALCSFSWLHAQTLPAVPVDPPKEGEATPDMTFGSYQYCGVEKCEEVAVAVGTIRSNTPALMKSFMSRHPQVRRVYLHGPGGELAAGLRLGVALREMGLDTALTGKMRCFSACAYAFLGGVARRVEPGGLLGLHQFSSQGSKEVTEGDIQQAHALLEAYMRGLAVPRGLLDLAARTSNEQIYLIDANLAVELQMDNHSAPIQDWSISFPDGAGATLMTKGRSYAMDRRAAFSIVARSEQIAVSVIFHEPAVNSSARRIREIHATDTPLVVCRHHGSGSIDRKQCVVGKLLAPWVSMGDRMYGATYGFEPTAMESLVEGAVGNEVALGIWNQAKTGDQVLLLNTHASGFSQGMRLLLQQ